MKKNILLIMSLALVITSWFGCTKGGGFSGLTGEVYNLTGVASSKQLIPAFDTTATGNFSGWYDAQAKSVSATISWDKLWLETNKDTITSFKIFGPAAIGATGPLLKTLTAAIMNSSGSFLVGLSGSTSLSNADITNLLAGQCYYTICTKKYPNGMVRGQINAVKRDANAPIVNLVSAIEFPATNKTLLNIGDTTTLGATVLPVFATNKAVEWKTLNPSIASIDASTGKVTALTKGLATLTATAKDGSGIIGITFVAVNYTLAQLATTGWTVTASSEKVSDGGGKDMILDGLATTWWHCAYSPNVPLPHWLIVDMKIDNDISNIRVARKSGSTDTKTVVVETSLDGVAFVNVGTIAFGTSTENSGNVSFFPRKAHYFRLTITESNRSPFANIADVYVSGYR